MKATEEDNVLVRMMRGEAHIMHDFLERHLRVEFDKGTSPAEQHQIEVAHKMYKALGGVFEYDDEFKGR